MHDDKVTTPTISTILLVPADGDPHGLLACDLVLGTRPPMMHEPMSARGREPVPWAAGPPPRGRDYYARALVLAHDGKPVQSGCGVAEWARVDAVYDAAEEPIPDHAMPGRYLYPQTRLALRFGGHELAALARTVQNLGTLIALDPAGRDVTDEVMRGR